MSSKAAKLNSLVQGCRRCPFVDKPLVKYEAYLKWLPEKVRVLAIGESPPPGLKDSVFYNTSRFDRFRECMKMVAGVKSDIEVLELFKSRGVFVTGAVKCRPLSKETLEEMRVNCLPLLRVEVNELRPRRLVAMGWTAARSVSELLNIKPPASLSTGGVVEARLKDIVVYFTPHPNYVLRFRRDLASRLRRALFK